MDKKIKYLIRINHHKYIDQHNFVSMSFCIASIFYDYLYINYA